MILDSPKDNRSPHGLFLKMTLVRQILERRLCGHTSKAHLSSLVTNLGDYAIR